MVAQQLHARHPQGSGDGTLQRVAPTFRKGKHREGVPCVVCESVYECAVVDRVEDFCLADRSEGQSIGHRTLQDGAQCSSRA